MTPHMGTTERPKMSDTKNFFENPNGNSGNGWNAGIGGAIGAVLGSGGFGGFGANREPTVTPDQLDARFNSLQGQMGRDSIRGEIADVALGLGAGISGVKDAVNHASAHNQLALCGLGHTVQSGNAQLNQTILLQGAASRELALQQALDAERVRATELRIALSEQKNSAGHTATQVMVQSLVTAGK